MPQNSTHPLYDKMHRIWQKCRDFSTGSDAVKSAGEHYLPNFFRRDLAQLSEFNREYAPEVPYRDVSGTQYGAYLWRAMLSGATARTVEGLVGAAMRKAPIIRNPSVLDPFVADMLHTGVAAVSVAASLLAELLITGRVGVLVDRLEGDNGRLRLCLYLAEDIINWGRNELTDQLDWVVLRETRFDRDPDDFYAWNETVRYRELDFREGIYQATLWEQSVDDKNATAWVGTPLNITRRQSPLAFFPFFMITPGGESSDICMPPILDLVNVELAWYQNSASLEHGLFFCGCPTPWGSGINPSELPGGSFTLGSTQGMVFPDPAAKVDILGLDSSKLKGLFDAMEQKNERMAQLGVRLLGSSAGPNETATAARIHQSGEANSLITNVDAVGFGLKRALEIARDWEMVSGEVAVEMNKDFVAIEMSGQDLLSLLQTYQGGAMSLPTFVWNLKQGERLPENRTIEDEMALIAEFSSLGGLVEDVDEI